MQEQTLEAQLVEGYQLSRQQKRLWILQQAEKRSVYNSLCAVLLEGDLQVKALKDALETVIARHEICRTSFHSRADLKFPLQVAASASALHWKNVSLIGLSPDEKREAFNRLFHLEGRFAFDFEQAPLLHLTLIALSACQNILLINMPSLCADVLSLHNLLDEISTAYGARFAEQGELEEVVQYVQFSEWQNQLLEDEPGAAEVCRDRLDSAVPPVLPFEGRPDEASGFNPHCLELKVDAAVAAKVRDVALRHETTADVLMMSCWQTLLWRLSGQPEEIVTRNLHHGRNHEELKGALGLFAGSLPAGLRFDEDLKFSELLRQARQVSIEIEEREKNLAPGDEHCFDEEIPAAVCFEFETKPSRRTSGGVVFSIYRQQVYAERFKIRLTCIESDDAFITEFHYDTGYFQASDVQRLASEFHTMLAGAVEEPAASVSALEILGDRERERLLVELNDTSADYPRGKCLHELIEEQTERTPEHVALEFEHQQLTYRQLMERSNQLAHYLRGLGVEAETRVGILMERSIEMVVGMLGVLKAGGAYVPLEAGYPEERLRFMIEDAELEILLSQQFLSEKVTGCGAQLINMDSINVAISQMNVCKPAAEVAAENLIYVIYTSGTTGQPKGAMLTHEGVVNCLNWMQATYGLNEQDRFLFKTSLNFDPSVWEVFWPLCIGASVCIAQPEGQLDNSYLVNYIIERGITAAYFVPSALRVFLEEKGVDECRSLKRVICGGEELPVQTMQRFFSLLEAKLHHSYGPTETSIAATESVCERHHQAVSMGRPLANTRIYILDETLRPVPLGVAGELFIGGTGLGRGYLNRPELTAEKFIPDLFGGARGGRLYRTGDLARYLSNGDIQFLGRTDYQLKIRGFRIELGEIEAALRRCPAVLDGAVVAREDSTGGKRLLAYVAREKGEDISPAELVSFLEMKLPKHMIPSLFIMMDALPLMHNGKINRRLLPEPEQCITESERAYVPPCTPIEEVLAGIWREVLGVERVGVEDDFFRLGGHSLLATQVISRVRSAFQVETALHNLFEAPTVKSLAERIEKEMSGGSGLRAAAIVPLPRGERSPLSFAQRRLWFMDQLETGNSFYNIPAAVHLSGPLKVEALEKSFGEIIRRHEILRTTFAGEDGKPEQVIHPPGPFTLPVFDLSDLRDEQQETEVQLLVAEEARRSFDLTQGPLLFARLLRRAEDEHVLLLTMHHIISDGWSVGIMIREAAALYEAFSNGRTSPLTELSVQYADFAIWQRKSLRGEALEEQLSYWKKQLQGVPPMLELPANRPRPAVQSFRGAQERFALPPVLSEALKKLSQQESVTLYMLLLTAFQSLLHHYSGQTDMLLGTVIAGRNRRETEGLIGFFVNTLAMRADLSGDPRFIDLLKRTRETALSAYAHQDLPFDKLVEEIQPERSLSHTPLLQAVFVLQNAPAPELQLSGLKLSAQRVEHATSKFDLTIQMEELEDGLSGIVDYRTDLFNATTIKRMTEHYRILLEGIVASPERRLSELPLLTQEELHQTLVEWNDTRSTYPDSLCVQELFEARAALTPEATAAVYGEEQITYGELNRKANQLSHHLRRLGVGAESRVGILMHRSLEMVVGLLGILKAGGAYVPLDPEYPAERLDFMLRDAAVAALLTKQQLVLSLPVTEVPTICTDTDARFIAQESAENPVNLTTPANLAYVIYTSGSTGKPKGVCITHQAINRLVFNTNYIELEPSDRVAQASNASFDASTFEIWGALLHGATLVGIEKHVALSPQDFVCQLRERKVSTLFLTTALFNQVARHLPQAFSTLRCLLFGGEAVDPRWASVILKNGAPERLLHVYGPTESTTFASWQVVNEIAEEATTIPIGKPISNTKLYLLDSHLRPAAVGVPGEIYVGGYGLARGYLDRPALTAERFVPHPFASEPGERLYKTGDMGRYLPGGEIEFLNRVDQQVKIHGFRIEPGEIEAALSRHEEVKEVFVSVHEDESGKQLVAYVVTKGEENSTAAHGFRRYLKERLPEYMIPTAFVILKEMPLTPNGKIDRRALPAPALTRPNLEYSFVAPQTETEKQLAVIWCEVLNIEQVGMNDNFFDLGGHSLLVAKLIALVREAVNIELPLRLLFEAPTPAEMASAIELMRVGAQNPSVLGEVDLAREASLDEAIYPVDAGTYGFVNEPRNIFLTGATGFLGAFLLSDLLEQTSADVFCLVRSSDSAGGLRKIQETLAAYSLWKESLRERIIPVVGDLSQPLLGLSEEQFQFVAGKIDVIYHNGALVNFILPYSALKASNVLGTQEVLRLACRDKTKPVHYVSTISIFPAGDDPQNKVFREDDDADDPTGLHAGYSQSKWVAEKLVRIAGSRGLPVTIYRPGRVTGESQLGITNLNDFACRFVKGTIELGSTAEMDDEIDLTPVDYVSRALVYLSRQRDAPGKIFHLSNPRPAEWRKIVSWIRSFGYPLRELPFNRWRAELESVPENPLYPLLDSLPTQYDGRRRMDGKTPSAADRIRFDCRHTLENLSGSSITCPAVDAQLLSIYFSYFARSGFLASPEVQGQYAERASATA